MFPRAEVSRGISDSSNISLGEDHWLVSLNPSFGVGENRVDSVGCKVLHARKTASAPVPAPAPPLRVQRGPSPGGPGAPRSSGGWFWKATCRGFSLTVSAGT